MVITNNRAEHLLRFGFKKVIAMLIGEVGHIDLEVLRLQASYWAVDIPRFLSFHQAWIHILTILDFRNGSSTFLSSSLRMEVI